MSKVYAVIAGGGTAGHVVPGLAIGMALAEAGHAKSTIHFVGSRRGIDRRIIEPEGFPLTLLPGRGIARRLTLANIGAALGLIVAFLRSIGLLVRLRPRVVISMGGYAAAPFGLVAGLARVPLVLAEQNAVPTATHRMLARFATASAVPFEGTPLPGAVVTGNPVRSSILGIDQSPAGKKAAREALGLPSDRFVLVAFGGSLGSRRINDAVWALAAAWRNRSDIAIRHVVGERDWDEVAGQQLEQPPGGLVYQAVQYEDRMAELLNAADMAVCRSGGSVAELAIARLPAVLVPLPIAPFDHQTHNASALVSIGGGILVPDPELDGDRLALEVGRLVDDRGTLAAMADALEAVAAPDAAARVAALVEQVARG
ncbi:MAG: UDP-N-acetylglucosamine--N-acetylmuramyl-(pentapeptide) pyrophosphoryl-undecaprenol N-acetylglucosamine transferase [Acidimicrobiales bacterium]